MLSGRGHSTKIGNRAPTRIIRGRDGSPTRRTHGWKKKLIDAPGGDTLFRAGHARLSELAGADESPRHLVHADLINRNVLVADGRLSAVFDWGCSVYGDFLYDIAWLEFWSPWYPALEAVGLRGRFREHCADSGFEIANFDARIQACLIHIGLDHLAYNAHTGSMEDMEPSGSAWSPCSLESARQATRDRTFGFALCARREPLGLRHFAVSM